MCFARNHRRRRALFGIFDCSINRHRIMAVYFLHIPAAGLEAGHLVRAVGQIDRPVDRDVVIVPKHDEL